MSGGIVHPSAPGDRRSWGILDGRPEAIDASDPDRATCRGDAALGTLPELWTHRAAPTAPWKTTEQVFHSYHRASKWS
jgi:hypothetical protein